MLTNRKSLVNDKPLIFDGDVLLFRRPPGSLIAKAITTSGRSDYSHAAMVAILLAGGCIRKGRCYCVEVREGVGGRAVTLESQVKKYPGLIDVYGCNLRENLYHRSAAVQHMLGFTGQPYGWGAIFRAAFAYLAFFRWFYKTNTDDKWETAAPVFCSEAVSRAMRVGGRVDPVVNLADCDTEPGDLARSDVLEYRFTLEP